MQVRRLLTAGIWLATTAAATAMVWTATSVVAGDVTDRPPTVVAPREVAQALREEVTPAGTAPPASAPGSPTSTTSRPPEPPPPPVGATQSQAPAPTLPPSTASTTTTTTTLPGPTTTLPPAPDPTATFSTSGGVVTAACSGFFIRLVAATPADGYAVEVLDRGPASVHAHFVRRAGQDVRVRLVCFGGRPIRIPDQHEDEETKSEAP
ncbi:MAG: hypothetical protein ACRD0S_00300 [Acidimicrobiales bacterium]